MRRVTSSLTISWDIHDSWTETLAGSVFLINLLKEQNKVGDKAHLCRLVLISANHLIEKLFFDLVSEFSNENFIQSIGGKKIYQRSSLCNAMHEWPQKLLPNNTGIDFTQEPYLSSDLLRKQRNSAIHKNSELVSLEMAQKALYTALDTCNSIWILFHGSAPFKYQGFVEKYVIENVGQYSTAYNINQTYNKANSHGKI